MRAPISVIVPTLNAEAHLNGCLNALMPGLEAGLIRELVVCDGGSSDGTVEIAKAWGADIVTSAPSRGKQLARGCAAAQGRWLLVLHADTQLRGNWVGPVSRHMGSGKAGWFRLAFDESGIAGTTVATWANLRSRFGLPYGDQGLLVPAKLYQQVGGYPDQPLMEDVAMVRRLKGQLDPIDAVAVTSAARFRREGWMRRGARNLWFLLRYLGGASPHRLAKTYD